MIRIMLTLCLNNVNLKLALNKIFAVSTHSLSHKDCQSSLVESWIVETTFLTSPAALLTLGLFTNVCFSYVFDAVPQLCQMVAFQKRAMLTQLKNQDIFQIQTSREREPCLNVQIMLKSWLPPKLKWLEETRGTRGKKKNNFLFFLIAGFS